MDTIQARRAVWLGHIQAWHDSGLTQVAYCRQHDLKPKALGYWIRRNRQALSGNTLTLVPLTVRTPQAPPAPSTATLCLQHPQWLASTATRWTRRKPNPVSTAWRYYCTSKGAWWRHSALLARPTTCINHACESLPQQPCAKCLDGPNCNGR
ncbi:IS66 family insertion sequence element accessory protein TnpA [Azotobacter beijerinckii]|uniref:IS66 family insertion sequence element accessory protein TnpA n=1 Tax=Azotobacter beijerinckii TaxID=170623 RepID=UPI003CC79EA6